MCVEIDIAERRTIGRQSLDGPSSDWPSFDWPSFDGPSFDWPNFDWQTIDSGDSGGSLRPAWVSVSCNLASGTRLANKKTRQGLSLASFGICSIAPHLQALTLGELDATSGTTETVLLAFLHTGVSGEVSVVAERLENFLVETAEGASDTHLACFALACRATARAADVQIDGVPMADKIEDIGHLTLFAFGLEILVIGSAIHRNGALACSKSHAGHGGFASPNTQQVAGQFVFLDLHVT
jgi:hypothetical protein